MKKILDASVIIKWFIKEEGSLEALRYLQDFSQGQFAIIVPTLLFYELGNAFVNKKATSEYVGEIMNTLHGLNLEVIDVGFDSFRKIFQNAKEYGITFYDASYVTLMQKENCELVTADRKLHGEISKSFKKVKLIAYSRN